MSCLLALYLLSLGAAAMAQQGTVIQMSTEEKRKILDAHNVLRARTARGETPGAPSGCDLTLMEYDEEVAARVGPLVKKCVLKHDKNADRAIAKCPRIGQNAATAWSSNHSNCVERWFSEYEFFNYDTLGCQPGEMCGHYTQVVWAKSKLVGCAASNCGPSRPKIVVCNYGPAGNYIGRKPYRKGPPASCCSGEATWNYNGLCATKEQCDSAGVDCQCTLQCANGGTLDAENCKCSCTADFYGSTCEKKCEDYQENGFAGYCAWSGRDCGRYAAYCRKSCNNCKEEPGCGDSDVAAPAGVTARVPNAVGEDVSVTRNVRAGDEIEAPPKPPALRQGRRGSNF